jgi:uncharacterized RDD family membrane protein YckC
VGRRILAYLIDSLIIGALSALLIVPLFNDVAERAPSSQVQCLDGFDSSGSFDDPSAFDQSIIDDTRATESSELCLELGDEVLFVRDEDANRLTSQVYGIGFGFQLLNLVVLQGLVGASLGKLIVGLRVVREDGSKAGIGWALLRWVFLFIDSICCFLPGLVLVFSTKGHRRLGDMVASTYVVRSKQMGTPPMVPGAMTPGTAWTGPTGMQGYAPGPPAGTTWGAPAAPAPAAPNDGPTWDEARNTYIQYDRPREQWVKWDEASSSWVPIDQ